MTKYKKEVEIFIEKKFTNTQHLYKKGLYNNIHYRGWLHLKLI